MNSLLLKDGQTLINGVTFGDNLLRARMAHNMYTKNKKYLKDNLEMYDKMESRNKNNL